MGKKKKDKNITVRDSDFYTPDKQMRKTLDYFGVKAAGGGGRPGNMGTGSDNRRTADDVKADLKQAKASHYAFNRGLEAAAMSGDKKSKSLMNSGMGNVGGIMRGVKHLSKLKKDNFGGGGMNGGENQSVLAYDLVNKDREEQTATYDEKYAKTTDLNSLKDKLMAQATEDAATPIEPSDRMAGVEERLEGASSNSPPSLFDKDNADPAKADDQKDAARNFLDDYKLDVAKGANIKSDIATGVSNAARHVRDTYGR